MPPEFEFAEDSEYAFSIFPPGYRQISPTPKAERARRASEDEIAAMTEGQTLVYVLRITGADDAEIITPEQAENYNKDEVSYLARLYR